MAKKANNWITVTQSEFQWELEALEFVRAQFPTHGAYRAWSNFEFVALDGSINEVDLLVLTEVGFFLVEIKSNTGVLQGDTHQWTWRRDGRAKTVDSPVLLANRKAKKLKSLLERQNAIRRFKGRMAYLESLVFCSGENVDLQLTPGLARNRVCLRDRTAKDGTAVSGIMAAITERNCPGLEQTPHSDINEPLAKAISQAMVQAGIRESQRARKVSDYVLKELLEDGPHYQDWLAAHVRVEDSKRRVRIYTVRKEASAEDRATIERAAKREYQLVEMLQHPGVLRVNGYTEHDLGPALVFEHPDKSTRLDHYLAQHGELLPLHTRLDLIRQLAEVVQYAHDKRVLHRALSPQSVLVVESDRPTVKVMNWMVGSRSAGTHSSDGVQITATRHLEQLIEDQSMGYLAPETTMQGEDAGEHVDVFSLGTIAWHILSGRPAATSAIELSDKLRGSDGLLISSVVPGAGSNLQELIQFSTHPEVSIRDSARGFLARLDSVEEELTDPDEDLVEDPTLAQTGERLPGGYIVKRRLGTGSCAVALLVEKGGEEFVLKVANNEDNNDRLRDEGEVLAKLHQHQNIVAYQRTEEINHHTCLVLKSAGTETLRERLRREGRLSVDFLQRFGKDLLQVVEFLEIAGVAHRDIKPDNIGISQLGPSSKNHLVLFDFSLSRTAATNITAGTKGYLDPFLPIRKRWDLHGDRYAAAVTLYEMATGPGMLPVWGDGETRPDQQSAEVTIDAERLEAGLREQLTRFFERAFRREASKRFDNAEQMSQEWLKCFSGVDARDVTDEETEIDLQAALAKATRETRIAELSIGVAATNALIERANVMTVQELLDYPRRKIRRMPGVGNRTRTFLLRAVEILRERLGGPEGVVSTDSGTEQDETGNTSQSVDALVQIVTKANARTTKANNTEQNTVLALLGLDPQLDSVWPSQAEVAASVGKTGSRIGQVLATAQKRWKKESAITKLRNEIVDLVRSSGGVLSVRDLASAVLLSRGSAHDEPLRTRHAVAITRAATEVERLLEDPRWQVARNRNQVCIAIDAAHLAWAKRLGQAADDLAGEETLAAPARVIERLQSIKPPPLKNKKTNTEEQKEPLPGARLVRLAASVSQNAAVSSRQELYPRGMDAQRALKLSHNALLGMETLTVRQVRERVRGCYPEAEQLPDRPKLDEWLEELRIKWSEDQSRYVSNYRARLSIQSGSQETSRRPSVPGTPSAYISEDEATARQFAERLDRSHRDGGFLTLTVTPKDFQLARSVLKDKYDLQEINFEQRFLKSMKQVSDQANADWDFVTKTDAKPNEGLWDKLMVFVRRAIPPIEQEIRQSNKPVLLVFADLLARYEQMQVLERLRDNVGERDGLPGLWLLIPAFGHTAQPMLNHKPVPLISPGQAAEIPWGWLKNLNGSGS